MKIKIAEMLILLKNGQNIQKISNLSNLTYGAAYDYCRMLKDAKFLTIAKKGRQCLLNITPLGLDFIKIIPSFLKHYNSIKWDKNDLAAQ